MSAAPGRAADAAAPDAPRISGYEPGALGRVVELHGRWYARHWKFGAYFEALVAQGLAEFLGNFDAARDGYWICLLYTSSQCTPGATSRTVPAGGGSAWGNCSGRAMVGRLALLPVGRAPGNGRRLE